MITGLAICLVLAFIVGGTLALAHAITHATAARDDTFAREFPELFPTPATRTVYDQMAAEYPHVAARIEAAALNDDAAMETWLRNGWTP